MLLKVHYKGWNHLFGEFLRFTHKREMALHLVHPLRVGTMFALEVHSPTGQCFTIQAMIQDSEGEKDQPSKEVTLQILESEALTQYTAQVHRWLRERFGDYVTHCFLERT